jgi:predicted ATP-grasp superfamily ATP-dependent carboligase
MIWNEKPMEERLRVFALEYATGGGCLESPSLSACRAEGGAMLRQLVTDLADVPGIATDIVFDVDEHPAPASHVHRVASPEEVRALWRRLLAASDLFWPIAPESAGLLSALVEMAQEVGCRPLASDPPTIEIAASKSATAQCLAAYGIPCVPTLPAGDPTIDWNRGWVVKPDDGIGCEDVTFLPTSDAVQRWRDQNPASNHVIQPFIPGTPLSLSLLAQNGEAWLLTCNIQDVRCDRVFSYHGGWTGGAEHRRSVLEPLASHVAAALPGLWGYVGIDLVDSVDGPIVLEVNPRLTTSYVGLRSSIDLNPAELVLAMVDTPLSRVRRSLSPRPIHVEIGA